MTVYVLVGRDSGRVAGHAFQQPGLHVHRTEESARRVARSRPWAVDVWACDVVDEMGGQPCAKLRLREIVR